MEKADSQQTIQDEITITGKGVNVRGTCDIDLETGLREFRYRLPACRYSGHPRSEGLSGKLGRHFAAMHQLTQWRYIGE